MRWLCVLTVLLVSSSLVSAEIINCYDTALPLGSRFTARRGDPSSAQSPCLVVTKASGQTAAQEALISTVPWKYLKTVPPEPLAVELSAAEKTEVDTYLTEQAAYRAQFSEELSTQEYCNTLTLDDVNTKIAAIEGNIHTDIDGAATTPEKIEAMKRSFDKVLVGLQKIARCQISALRLRGGGTPP